MPSIQLSATRLTAFSRQKPIRLHAAHSPSQILAQAVRFQGGGSWDSSREDTRNRDDVGTFRNTLKSTLKSLNDSPYSSITFSTGYACPSAVNIGLKETYDCMREYLQYAKISAGASSMQQWLDSYQLKLKAVPASPYRDAWIEGVVNLKDMNGIMREATAKHILYVNDTETRDKLIEMVCHDLEASIRQIGAKLIPYHSNEATRQQLAEHALADTNGQVQKIARVLKGKTMLPRFLSGFFLLRGIPLNGRQRLNRLDSTKQAEHNLINSQDPEAQSLIQALDTHAQAMARRLQTYYRDKPEVRQALLEQYGSEEKLPKADEFKQLFYRSAKKYYQSQLTGWSKFKGSAVNEKEVLSLAAFMLRLAQESGHFFVNELKTENIALIHQIQEQQSKLDKDVHDAKKERSKQILIKVQSEEAFQLKQQQITELEKALASAKDKEENEETVHLFRKLEVEKKVLEAAKERLDTAKKFVQSVDNRIRELDYKALAYQARLSNAIQNGILTASQEELNRILTESEKSFDDGLFKDRLTTLEQGQYEVLADLERQKQQKHAQDFLDLYKATAPDKATVLPPAAQDAPAPKTATGKP